MAWNFHFFSKSWDFITAFILFLTPAQRYMAFLSVMLGVHAWIKLFLDPSHESWLALVFIYGAVLLFWLYLIRLWQVFDPQGLLYLNRASYSFWYGLDSETRKTLLKQMPSLNVSLNSYPCVESIEPFDGKIHFVNELDLRLHPLVIHSKVAVFTFAGGQATRLGTNIPKACLEIKDLEGEKISLLEYHSRYFKGLQDQGFHPFWAILTSLSNHERVKEHLEQNNYFGLNRLYVDCVCQKDLPLLDSRGKLWLHQKGHLLFGPDGNGSALSSLLEAEVINKWQKAGVEYVTLNLIDNPMAYPFEFSLIQSVSENPKGYALAVIEKKDPDEKTGVMARARLKGEFETRARIVEYTDIGKERSCERKEDSLLYRWANTGVMSLSLETLSKLALINPSEKGWHLATKKYELASGLMIEALKRESFIFDLLAYEDVEDPRLVSYSREAFFAPIKSIEDVEKTGVSVRERDLKRIKHFQDQGVQDQGVDVSSKRLWSFFRWP
jgi:UDP-N-acetylglucosamine pyrophosphorylase